MTKESNVDVVIKAQDEYTKGLGAENSAQALSDSDLGAQPGPSVDSALASEDIFASTYGARLEAEREFQRQKMEIINAGKIEESAVLSQESNELLSKEEEDNQTKLGNTKAMIGSSLSLMQTLMSGSKKNNKTMFEADKAYSVGKAVMSAYTGAANAIKDYPAPVSYVVAAASLAKGMLLAKSISSQKMGVSASSSSAGLGGTTSSTAGSTAVPYGDMGEGDNKGTQNVVVNIHNPLSDENWAKVVEDNIIPALENAGDRNVVIDMNA